MSEIQGIRKISGIQGIGNMPESENKLTRSRKHVTKREQADKE
jgi:hypothetical protein